MKLIYIVIDGMGDLPIKELGNKTPLQAAKTPHMDSLARNGKTGLMYTVGKGIAPESDVAVVSILGYNPFRYNLGRGIFEALGSGLNIEDGDLALRCNFATLGRGKQIVDRRAGRNLTTEEAKELSEAMNERVKLESHPADFEFRNSTGHRGVLIIRSEAKKLSSQITNTDPAYSRTKKLSVAEPRVEMRIRKCKPMDETDEAKISAELVNEFVEKSHDVLDGHEVNRRRAAERKLQANLILTRDAGNSLPRFFNINERYGFSFVCLVDMPVERGISKLAGMHAVDLPPPSHDLAEDCRLRAKKLLGVLALYDCVYIHIKGPDEPGHDGKFELKTRMIAQIDKHFFGNLLKKIRLEDCIICVTADHSTPCRIKSHSDDPVPLLVSGDNIKGNGFSGFSEKECLRGSLGVLKRGTELLPKLVQLLRKATYI